MEESVRKHTLFFFGTKYIMGITSEGKDMTYSTDTRFFEKVEEEKLEVSEILALVYEAYLLKKRLD